LEEHVALRDDPDDIAGSVADGHSRDPEPEQCGGDDLQGRFRRHRRNLTSHDRFDLHVAHLLRGSSVQAGGAPSGSPPIRPAENYGLRPASIWTRLEWRSA